MRRRPVITVVDDTAVDPDAEPRFYLWLYQGDSLTLGPLRIEVVDTIGREQDLGRVRVLEGRTETVISLDGAEWLRMTAHDWEKLVVAAIGDR